MLYHLFEYLNTIYDFPGSGLFQYISFRSAMAIIFSLLVSLVFRGKIIRLIKKSQISEEISLNDSLKKQKPQFRCLIANDEYL